MAEVPAKGNHSMSQTLNRMLCSVKTLVLKCAVYRDTHAQDLIEYSLMAGFVATAAGAIMPGVSTSISRIFSRVAAQLVDASNTPNG